MGNQESRQAHSKKAVSGPYRPPQTKTKPINVPADRQQQQQPTTAHDPPSSPQQQQQHQQQQSQPQSPQPMPFDSESYSMNTSAISRPPRLPLPIEEEDYTPGSPIISPADVSRIGPVGPIEPLEEVAGFPRRSSVLSSTTLDDDDLGDDLGSLEGGPHVPVPTLLEWREAGDKVYVTGTFAGWDRKFRLHKNGPSKHPGALSAIINLQPGTHHVRFIVDNDMKLSKYMPTAVDFTNFLVNYIEVGPEDIQTAAAALHSLQLDGKGPPTTQPKPIAGAIAPQPQVTEELAQTPQVLPAAEEPKDALAEQLIKGKPLVPAEPKSYHGKIPGFLLDLDAPEEGEGKETCAKVNSLVNTLPSPPTLPMFLAKSILNGNPPMRDDASVLILPNHTVLNHLATSSIRNGVLATSGTTRYKQKFLTTIMYKPTGRD
ncbi:carbohydrate-binding module family 48 protein [Venturia nashicola]|uniref:Carbohydrate-binding module family 48 protein n=1 Tax=Venturia nashicola TaxID=86259 RepID=A0A4Z1P528_9PEZI|nr:carbohydrate-binding module family 48 protein [Venturia nashicola]